MRGLGIDRRWRGMGVLLVALALAVRLAAPTGWMLASSDTGPRLVICTGHGAMALDTDPAKAPTNRPDKSNDHVCVFAGAHAAPTPLALVAAISTPVDLAAEPPVVAPTDQRPGQGLAAPPPPSHGPPASPI